MNSRPWFGKPTADRRQAFPELISLDLTVRQDPFRMHARHDWQRMNHCDETDFPTSIACLNARCQQGGLELENIIRFSREGTTRHSCRGHEGTPKARRHGDPCDNYFDVDLKIVRTSS